MIDFNPALIQSSSLVEKFPALSTSYVRGIQQMAENHRNSLFQSSGKHIIYWEVPFLLNNDKQVTHSSGFGQNMLIGICRLVTHINSRSKILQMNVLIVTF